MTQRLRINSAANAFRRPSTTKTTWRLTFYIDLMAEYQTQRFNPTRLRPYDPFMLQQSFHLFLRTNSLLHRGECRGSGEKGGEKGDNSLHGGCILFVIDVMLWRWKSTGIKFIREKGVLRDDDDEALGVPRSTHERSHLFLFFSATIFLHTLRYYLVPISRSSLFNFACSNTWIWRTSPRQDGARAIIAHIRRPDVFPVIAPKNYFLRAVPAVVEDCGGVSKFLQYYLFR